jgi:hypothetical protein
MRIVRLLRKQEPDSLSGLHFGSMVRVSTHGLPIVQQEPHHPFGVLNLTSTQLRSDCTPARKERKSVNSSSIQQLRSDSSMVNPLAFLDVQKLRAVDYDKLW